MADAGRRSTLACSEPEISPDTDSIGEKRRSRESDPFEHSPTKRKRPANDESSDRPEGNRPTPMELEQILLARIQLVRRRAQGWLDLQRSQIAAIKARKAARSVSVPERTVNPLIPFARGDPNTVERVEARPNEAMNSAMEILDEEELSSVIARSREDEIIRKALDITRRNSALARERLPKQPEAPRSKAHWDYLLDEMAWMASDFREEHKWKVSLAKKVSKLVVRHFQDKDAREDRQRKEETVRLRRRANAMARDVRRFWSQIAQLAEYRESLYREARKREERDRQLNDLLGETQRFSTMIANDMATSGKRDNSLDRNMVDETVVKEVAPTSEDDETIASNEEFNEEEDRDEVSKLAREADLTIEEMLRQQGIDPETYKKGLDESFESESESESNLPNGQMHVSEVESVDGGECAPVKMTIVTSKRETQSSAPSSTQELRVIENDVECDEKEKSMANTSEKRPKSKGSDNMEHDEGSQLKEDRADEKEFRLSAGSANGDGFRLNAVAEAKKVIVPFLLQGTLRDYQQEGLEWMAALYERNVNGILADEMGLGKTIMSIALLAWLAVEKGDWGPHLVVAPTSVLINWEIEFKKWCPGFKILTYHGSIKERRTKRSGWTKNNAFHVCITSYNLVVQDANIFRRKKWVYLILDEAQNIKNFQSQRWQTLLFFSSRRRLLLTGTPLQNSIMELWSLMHFLMPDVFRSHSEFKEWFSSPINAIVLDQKKGEERNGILRRLHEVLRPFLLRRLKKDVEKGLPAKKEHVVVCPLSKRQRRLYEDFMARTETKETLESGNFLGVMNVLMQLRKVCNHPDLFDGRPITSPFLMNPLEVHFPELLSRKRTDAVGVPCFNAFSTLPLQGVLDLTRLCAGQILLQSSHQSDRRDRLQDPLATVEKRRQSECSRLVHMCSRICQERCFPMSTIFVEASSVPTIDTSVMSRSIHARASGKWFGFTHGLLDMVWTVESLHAGLESRLHAFGICVTRVATETVQVLSPGRFALTNAEEQNRLLVERSTRPIRELVGSAASRQTVMFPDPGLIQWDCGKFQTMVLLLRELQKRGSRCLIFTQMARMLDILEQFLNLHDYRYLRLDGATKTDDRQRLTERFNTDDRYFCMILTTRAGGVGINLTGADSVIFYDSDWNPAIDAQAQDRAHRIGQTKEVHIYRLVSERTIEENILHKANEKRTLESLVISKAAFTTDSFRQKLDIMSLVQSEPGQIQADSTRDSPQKKQEDLEDIDQPSDPGGAEVDEKKEGEPDSTGLGLLLLAAEDDQEREWVVSEARAKKLEAEEFEDHVPLPQEEETGVGEQSVEEERQKIVTALTSIQRYALQFFESSVSCDDGEDLHHSRVEEDHISLDLTRSLEELDKVKSLRVSPPRDEPELFYEVVVDDESHLKAMLGTDEDLKIYLPLRDGGPEELVMSTVVGGTAAAGLESAEDAAFFPHAYARMGRTERATRRQKERASQKKREDLERRKREEALRSEAEKRKLEDSSKSRESAPAPPTVPSKASPTMDLRKLTMVAPQAMSISSSVDSKGNAGPRPTKRPKVETSLSDSTRKSERYSFAQGITWTVEEDIILRAVSAKFSNFSELWATWMNLQLERFAGYRSLKTAANCEERLALLQSALDPSKYPGKNTAGPEELISRKHFDAIHRVYVDKKKRTAEKAFSPSHPSHRKLEDALGSCSITPGEVIRKLPPPKDHVAGQKPGTQPRSARRPLLRSPREEKAKAPDTASGPGTPSGTSPAKVSPVGNLSSSKVRVSVAGATSGSRIAPPSSSAMFSMQMGGGNPGVSNVNSQLSRMGSSKVANKKALVKTATEIVFAGKQRSASTPTTTTNGVNKGSHKKKSPSAPSGSSPSARARVRTPKAQGSPG